MRIRIHQRAYAGAAFTIFLAACGGDSGTGPKASAPTIARVSPAQGTVGTELTITGAGFKSGVTVLVGAIAATNVELTDATTLYATVPVGVTAGQAYSVTVRNSDGGSTQHVGAFTPVAPTLLYVNGATRPSGNSGSTVILEGTAFGDIQGTGQVLFSDGAGGTIAAAIASADDWTDTFILTTVPAGAVTGGVMVRTATGTSAALAFALTTNAQFSPSTIMWTATTALPVGLSGHDAAVATTQTSGPTGPTATSNMVYVTGGADSAYAPGTGVYFSTVQSNGQLGTWTTTAPLPAARAFHASAIATPFNSRVRGAGFIYVLGGATTAAGAPSSTIYRAALDPSGLVGTWQAVAELPLALHSMGAVLFRGDLYVAGGSTTGNAPVSGVYRARIDSLGTLGAWQTLPALPSARTYHGLAQFGGSLYVLGGEDGTVSPNDSSTASSTTRLNEVLYAKIDLRTGGFTGPSWTVNGSNLSKAVGKHTAVVAGGSVLVTGGLYNGASTGSSEESYAQLKTDGTVSSFAGATGAHTIASAGGKNLFNHAAIGYVDASGVAHVLVLGGDDVNAPGKKRSEVWFY
jgi:hypothetical protein